MSVHRYIHIGPYAEYLVRPDQLTDAFTSLRDEFALYNDLWHNNGLVPPPEVVKAEVTYHRFCFKPGEDKLQELSREFTTDVTYGVQGIQDLRTIDSQAEIDWFARAFETELRAISDHLGRSPAFHWGVVGHLA